MRSMDVAVDTHTDPLSDLGAHVFLAIVGLLPLEDVDRCKRVCRGWMTIIDDNMTQHPELTSMWRSPSELRQVCYRVGRIGSDELLHHMFTRYVNFIPSMVSEMVCGAIESRSRSSLTYLLAMSDCMAEDLVSAVTLCAVYGDTKLLRWLTENYYVPNEVMTSAMLLETKRVCHDVTVWARRCPTYTFEVFDMDIETGMSILNMYAEYRKYDMLERVVSAMEAISWGDGYKIPHHWPHINSQTLKEDRPNLRTKILNIMSK